MSKFLALLLLLVSVAAAVRAADPDEEYLGIYTAIQQADALNNDGRFGEALAKYREIQETLRAFQRRNPRWNPPVMNFRLSYLAARLTALAPPAGSTTNAPASVPEASQSQNTINYLQSDVARLTAERLALEAKLKEALSAQKAAADPRDLARAEQRVNDLAREVDLLKATLAQEQEKVSRAPDAKVLEQTRQALALANRRLAEQADRAAALQRERDALQADVRQAETNAVDRATLEQARQALAEANRKLAEQAQLSGGLEKERESLLARVEALAADKEVAEAKVQSLAGVSSLLESMQAEQQRGARLLAEANQKLADQTATAETLTRERNSLQVRVQQLAALPAEVAGLQQAKEALEAANAQLASQTQTNAVLARERAGLQTQVEALTASARAAEALRAENALLKRQVAQAAAMPDLTGTVATLNRDLAASRAKAAALQSDKELLLLENIALEGRLRQVTAQTSIVQVVEYRPRPEDVLRIEDLERERTALARELAQTMKEPRRRPGAEMGAAVQALTNEVERLNARLLAYESRVVPYQAEDLGLLCTFDLKPVLDELLAAPRSAPGRALVNPGTRGGALLLQPAAPRPTSSARPAEAACRLLDEVALQLAAGRHEVARVLLDGAPTNAALEAAVLYLRGTIEVRQERYDEACEALGRAARLRPGSAALQDRLGVALAGIGMRAAAEGAFRQALLLQPDYPAAHHNLAVVCLAQEPPLVELARWHYRKALAAGLPDNVALERRLDQSRPAEPEAASLAP